jgi:hypothetical protein
MNIPKEVFSTGRDDIGISKSDPRGAELVCRPTIDSVQFMRFSVDKNIYQNVRHEYLASEKK